MDVYIYIYICLHISMYVYKCLYIYIYIYVYHLFTMCCYISLYFIDLTVLKKRSRKTDSSGFLMEK